MCNLVLLARVTIIVKSNLFLTGFTIFKAKNGRTAWILVVFAFVRLSFYVLINVYIVLLFCVVRILVPI